MYTWSPMEVVPTSLEGVGEKSPGYLRFKDYNDGVPTFRNFPVKVYTLHWIFFFLSWFNSIQFKWRGVPKLWRAYEENVVKEQWWSDASSESYCSVNVMKNANVSTF